jgi:hypothetical protein
MGARSRPTLLEGLLVAAMVVAVLSMLAPVLGPGGLGLGSGPFLGQPLSVDAQLRDPVPGLGGLDGTYEAGEAVELSGPTTVRANVYSPSWPQRLGLVGSSVVTGATTLGVLWLLLAITRTLRQGEVFVRGNARRLQRIALLVGAGGMAAQLLHQFGRAAVLEAATVREQVVATFEVSFLPLVAAFGIGVAAEAFRQGAALREDVEGLV